MRTTSPQFNRTSSIGHAPAAIQRKEEPVRNKQHIPRDDTMQTHLYNKNYINPLSIKEQLFPSSSAPKVYPEYNIFDDNVFYKNEQGMGSTMNMRRNINERQINPSLLDATIPQNFSMEDFDFLRKRVEERAKREERDARGLGDRKIINNTKNNDFKDFSSF